MQQRNINIDVYHPARFAKRATSLAGASHVWFGIVYNHGYVSLEVFWTNWRNGMAKRNSIAPFYRKVHLKQQPSDFAFWQQQPYSKRLAALEEIRSEYHHWKYNAEPRLQRVYQSLNDNQVRYLIVAG